MLFGDAEIREYENTCIDPIVLAIIKRLWESKSNASKWLTKCIEYENDYKAKNVSLKASIDWQREKINTLELENRKLKDDIEELEFKYRQAEDKLSDQEEIVRWARK